MTQPPATNSPASLIDLEQPFRLLARWAVASERWWYDLPESADASGAGMGCYGTGYNHWGLHTNLKYVAAMVTLATHEQTPSDVNRDRALARALAALRFTLASHKANEGQAGAIPLTDRSRWGQTWITALALERVMHVMPAVLPHLTDADQAAWRRVLLSEADWLLNHYTKGGHEGVVGATWNDSGKNVPESNIWNGCFLWRVAELYPDAHDAPAWRERAHRFLINGVSIAADATDHRLVAGRPVRDWFAGANFFDHYALDHHGYSNVGYMVICQSNAAMLHFDFKALGHPTPESLHHHQRDLWQVTRRLVFADGRLARIGGDSRVRYAYCQEFLVPTLLYAADCFHEPHAAALLRAQVQLMQREADHNGDGSFFGRRLEHLGHASPYYYTRLESDRACALSQLITYAPITQPMQSQRAVGDADYEASLAGNWHEPEHGDAVHRCPTRFASVSWHAHTVTQAICQPPHHGGLCDWHYNLTGRIRFIGDNDDIAGSHAMHRKCLHQHIRPFEGGFATLGRVREGVNLNLKDGWKGSDLADHDLAFAALPDGHTLVGLQHACTRDIRAFAAEVRGLGLEVLNDIYNNHRRRLDTAAGSRSLESPPVRDAETGLASQWANIDDLLGVVGLYGANELTLRSFAQPRAGNSPELRSMHVEQLNWHCRTATESFAPGAVMLDVGWTALASVDAAATRRFADRHLEQVIQHDDEGHRLRGVRLRGLDGHRYLVLANFGEADLTCVPRTLELPDGPWHELAGPETASPLTLPARQARVWRQAT